MKAEIKKQWLEALRSGTYAQGIRYLRRENDKFCCLGVLCDVVDSDSWNAPDGISVYSHSDTFTSILPPVVAKTAGLSNEDLVLDTLMGMNDTGNSFETIADWIEANIPAEN